MSNFSLTGASIPSECAFCTCLRKCYQSTHRLSGQSPAESQPDACECQFLTCPSEALDSSLPDDPFPQSFCRLWKRPLAYTCTASGLLHSLATSPVPGATPAITQFDRLPPRLVCSPHSVGGKHSDSQDGGTASAGGARARVREKGTRVCFWKERMKAKGGR